MIACRQLAFGLGQVERTAVGFRIAGNQVDDESYQSRENCIVPIRTTIVRMLSPHESS